MSSTTTTVREDALSGLLRCLLGCVLSGVGTASVLALLVFAIAAA